MKIRIFFKVAPILATLLFFAFDENRSLSAQPPQADMALGWAFKHYQAAVDELLPPKLADWKLPDGWRAVLRIVPAHEMEFHVLIEKPFESSPIRATVTRPVDVSLWQQLYDAKTKRSETTFSEALEALSIERTVLAEKDCPELIELTRELEELKTPATPPNLLVMDCTDFHFDIQTAYGGRQSFSFCGPKRGMQEAPLTGWGLRLQETISERCLSK